MGLDSDRVICSACAQQGEKSTATEDQPPFSTLAYNPPSYDAEGQRRSYDTNRVERKYRCSRGHSWTVVTEPLDRTARPAVPVAAEPPLAVADRAIALWRLAPGMGDQRLEVLRGCVAQAVAGAVAAEREACARTVEEIRSRVTMDALGFRDWQKAIDRIRARGGEAT